jgi:hypothetical protein
MEPTEEFECDLCFLMINQATPSETATKRKLPVAIPPIAMPERPKLIGGSEVASPSGKGAVEGERTGRFRSGRTKLQRLSAAGEGLAPKAHDDVKRVTERVETIDVESKEHSVSSSEELSKDDR